MKYIDAEELLKAQFRAEEYNQETGDWDLPVVAVDDIKAMPAADVAPVVRCRNCVHYERWGEETGFCERDEIQGKPDFFCYYGERRT